LAKFASCKDRFRDLHTFIHKLDPDDSDFENILSAIKQLTVDIESSMDSLYEAMESTSLKLSKSNVPLSPKEREVVSLKRHSLIRSRGSTPNSASSKPTSRVSTSNNTSNSSSTYNFKSKSSLGSSNPFLSPSYVVPEIPRAGRRTIARVISSFSPSKKLDQLNSTLKPLPLTTGERVVILDSQSSTTLFLGAKKNSSKMGYWLFSAILCIN